jgi:predicted permease
MTALVGDIRFALRAIRRSPLFASVAILSLALGIGANTAIFTLMDQLMLRRLPIRNPDQLVMLRQEGLNMGSNMGSRMHSYPLYQDLQSKAEPFSEVLCRRLADASLGVGNETERIGMEMVSGNYFTMLGVKPAAGRLFTPEEDDRTVGGHPVAVLSYRYWSDRFARDPNVVGRKILVNNYPMTIVGVSAAGFAGLDPAQSPQVRVPILMKETLMPEWSWFNGASRRARWVQVFARLKPGYTVQSAQAPLQVLYHQIREYETTLPAAKDWSAYSRTRFLQGVIHIEKAATGYSDLRNSFSTALIVLMSMVGLVLLIACGNVANLLIARSFARQKEIAVRLSIGASRPQLIRQLLVESLLLSFAGGVAGIVLAAAMTRGLLGLVPAENNPLLIQPLPDGRILLFTLAVTFVTGLIFGLVPALRASRPDLWSTLKDTVGSIAGGGSSVLLRKGLVIAQVALSFVLLFGAGLFVRSLQNLKGTDTGFRDVDNLVTFQLDPALNGYNEGRGILFYQQLMERVRAIPGVKAAAVAAVPVLHGDEWDNSMQVEGHKAKDGEDIQAFMNAISPGYFATMGVQLLEGRDFDRRDVKPDAKVAIVNQEFARHYFGERSAVGRHIGNDGGPNAKLETEIVGVVANTLYEGTQAGLHSARGRQRLGDLRARRVGIVLRLCGATAHRQGVGPRHAGVRDEDTGPATRRNAPDRAADGAAFRRLRPRCHAARRHRTLWRDGLRGRAPHARNGTAHGARSGQRIGDLAGDARGATAGRDRSRDRRAVGPRTRPFRLDPVVRHQGRRPVDRVHQRRAARRSRRAGGPDSRAPRQPHRPDPGASLRIGRLPCWR